MPRGRLELKAISHPEDRQPTFQADFLTEDSDLFSTSRLAEDMEELLYEQLRLPMPVADRLLNDTRSLGRAAVDAVELSAADLSAASMTYLRNDAA